MRSPIYNNLPSFNKDTGRLSRWEGFNLGFNIMKATSTPYSLPLNLKQRTPTLLSHGGAPVFSLNGLFSWPNRQKAGIKVFAFPNLSCTSPAPIPEAITTT
jgi:hypothetical protein